jgi:hypothetical protein
MRRANQLRQRKLWTLARAVKSTGTGEKSSINAENRKPDP